MLVLEKGLASGDVRIPYCLDADTCNALVCHVKYSAYRGLSSAEFERRARKLHDDSGASGYV